ncbi:unnamed protein product [Amoebophrya sp. A25]|nr:unnamed protein product [Amoebophrya sp. A25]|eukprot:GSA25T00002350001.1
MLAVHDVVRHIKVTGLAARFMGLMMLWALLVASLSQHVVHGVRIVSTGEQLQLGGQRIRYLSEFLAGVEGNFTSELAEVKAVQPETADRGEEANGNVDTEYAMDQSDKFYKVTAEVEKQSVRLLQELLPVAGALLKITGGDKGNSKLCGDVRCGINAICTQTRKGAQCLCAPGFYGDGLLCREPTSYIPQKLLKEGVEGASERIHDLEMIALDADRIAMVYRNADRNNRGYLMLGAVDGLTVDWATPELFSTGEDGDKIQAWEPRIAGDGNKLVINFRTAKEDGDCYVLSADLDPGMGKAFVEFSPVIKTCEKSGSGPMAGILFAPSTYAMFVNRQALDGKFTGEATLFELQRFKVQPSAVDPVQFANAPVGDLRARKMSPTTFLLEFSRTPRLEDNKEVQQEAVLSFGKFEEGSLTLLPGTVSAEPENIKQVQFRDVAVLSNSTAYLSYAVGASSSAVLKTVKITPRAKGKKIAFVTTRVLKRPGYAPFVTPVSAPLPAPPGSATGDALPPEHMVINFYAPEGAKNTVVEFCTVSPDTGVIDEETCVEKVLPGDKKMKELRALNMGGGRIVVTFTAEEDSIPYYLVYGVFRTT